jgi:hypothetical protein
MCAVHAAQQGAGAADLDRGDVVASGDVQAVGGAVPVDLQAGGRGLSPSALRGGRRRCGAAGVEPCAHPAAHLAAALIGDAHAAHVLAIGAGLDAQLRDGVDCGGWTAGSIGRACGLGLGMQVACRWPRAGGAPLGLRTELPQLVSVLM